LDVQVNEADQIHIVLLSPEPGVTLA